MATIKPRGDFIEASETVALRAQFYDLDGQPTDATTFPNVSIIQPSGNVVMAPTAAGVYKVDTGLYGFDYNVGLMPAQGVWVDLWTANMPSGIQAKKEFNFIVAFTQMPDLNTDGYYALGDDPGYHFNQTATRNINKALKALKTRLHSSGKKSGKDPFGNDIYVDCDIFSNQSLIDALCTALAWINSEPHFTFFEWHHTDIINLLFADIISLGYVLSVAAQSLIERGREYQVSDSGISFTPPTVSELLNTHYSTEYNIIIEKIKRVKTSMKPSPLGSGTITGNISRNPAYRRLRWLRSRQIY